MKVTIASFTCIRCGKDNDRREVIVYRPRSLRYRYLTECIYCKKDRYTPIINPKG